MFNEKAVLKISIKFTGADLGYIICIIWYTVSKNEIVVLIIPTKTKYSTLQSPLPTKSCCFIP